ncbi:MAG: septum formation protein Maf [Hyphomicrobium sp.]|nr:septum formation protein Maf [Hyphomicrobium sp.]
MTEKKRLILASGSQARRTMLEAAGVPFEVVAANIDEDAIRAAMMTENDTLQPADIAVALSAEKALSVARAHPAALVIGSDQILAKGQRVYSKAATLGEARAVLERLRGRKHELISAVTIAQGGTIVWQSLDSAELTMRNFSDAFLDDYMARCGAALLQSVGCYQLEGLGVHLFDSIDGDYFTILGMPLLPLLAELRNHGLELA